MVIHCPSPTTLCRYCFNLDHWVPVRDIAEQIPCYYCPECRMYIRKGEWEYEHEEHTNRGEKVVCSECPSCSGLIPEGERETECQFCEVCKSYVPLEQWESHQEHPDDPFDPFIK